MLRKLLIFSFSFILYFTTAISNNLKIVYVDIDKIINQSNAGKTISQQLKNFNKISIKKFKEREKKLTEEEKNIIKKKNLLSKEEFDQKVKILQADIRNYKKSINNSNIDIEKKRLKGTSEILGVLNPILAEYSSKNSISLIIKKKILL